MPSIEENTIMKKTLLILGMISLILAACGGGDATPIISAEDVEKTALADARTMVANTQAAIPTNTQVPEDTPVPPSPIPTETSIALATVPQPTDKGYCYNISQRDACQRGVRFFQPAL